MRVILTLLAALVPLAVGAHPGHDPVAVTGTLLRVLPERIEVETYDTTVMQKKTVSIVTDEYTRWKLEKKTAKPSDLAAGMSIVVAFTHADLKDGTEGLVALEIRAKELKKNK